MDLNECPCSGKTLARLLQPAVTSILAGGPAHGYAIAQSLQRLSMFRGQGPDPAGIYRLLKAMEDSGLVASTWDLEGSGPAKRRYRLTAGGRKCLARWVCTLEQYEQAIGELLGIMRAPV